MAAAGLTVLGPGERPNTPAAELVNRGAILLLDVAPLEDGRVDCGGEAGNVKYVPKVRKAAFVRDMGRGKGGYEGDAGCEEGEVDHVDVGHKVVRPPARDPGCDILGVRSEVICGNVQLVQYTTNTGTSRHTLKVFCGFAVDPLCYLSFPKSLRTWLGLGRGCCFLQDAAPVRRICVR